MDWEARVASLPTTSGVYLFKSRRGAVLYVGKAQNLRSRVRQYVSGGDGRYSIPALMERAVASGMLAANGLLSPWSVQPEPLWSVPRRGVLARFFS